MTAKSQLPSLQKPLATKAAPPEPATRLGGDRPRSLSKTKGEEPGIHAYSSQAMAYLPQSPSLAVTYKSTHACAHTHIQLLCRGAKKYEGGAKKPQSGVVFETPPPPLPAYWGKPGFLDIPAWEDQGQDSPCEALMPYHPPTQSSL